MAQGWKVIKHLTSGGASEVSLVVSPEGERVAVKVLSLAGPEAQSLFEKQVRILSRLRHPSIVSVQGYLLKSDVIFGDDRGPCCWMEYVEGADVVSAAEGADASKILEWFREALEALRYVHSQGVIHGDLSPKNILIDTNGKVRILDFSVLPGDVSSAEVATLPYMAPERIDGELRPASDLFSLGTIFYEALAGRHPRAGCRMVQELMRTQPVPLLKAAPRLKGLKLETRVIDRMIQADPSGRLSDAGKILDMLNRGRWEELSEQEADFHPVRMIGADRSFEAFEEALKGVAERSTVFGLHGPSGVGKTRFLREIGFEAAMKGIRFGAFEDLHRATPEERAKVLSAVRSFPATGTIAVLEWNDDRLSEEGRRFFGQLISAGWVREIRLGNLDVEATASLLGGVLEAAEVPQAAEILHRRTYGNPFLLLKTIQKLWAEKKLKGRSLLPGWTDHLRDFNSSQELILAKLGGVSPEDLRQGVPGLVEELRREGRGREAIEVIDFTIPILKDPADVSRLLRTQTNILNEMGRFGEAIACCDRWFALAADDEPMPLKTVKYWLVTGLNYQSLDRDDEAEMRLKRCLEEGARTPEDESLMPYRIRAYSVLGLQQTKRGHFDAAKTYFQKGLEIAGNRGWRRAEICRNLAIVLSKEGDWAAAKRLLDEARSHYRDEKHSEGEFSTYLQEGNLAIENDEPDAADAAYARAEEIARGMSSDLKLAVVLNNRGHLERLRGRFGIALDLLRQAHEVFRFLGNANDLRGNLRQLAVAEASVGRFEKAAAFLSELQEPGSETEKIVSDLREGKTTGSPEEIRKSLQEIYRQLPPELQITFVERGDYQKWVAAETARPQEEEMQILKDVLPLLQSLNRELLQEDDMTRVLNRLMDAAMRIARAESGFLVLKSDQPSVALGPLPGYEVAVARNVTGEQIATDTYAFSLSAIRRALQTGEPAVTDNALLDPFFKEARSVHLRQLKSILALPLKGNEGVVLGVFYLDHRLEAGLFEGDLLETLKTFAGIAALALQKGRMIDGLKRANDGLEKRVEDQTGEVRLMEREVKKSRLLLKNEYGEIIGRSPKMIEVLSIVDKITDSKVPVWVFGESGTGKEAIARSLHFNSGRAKKPFVSENCGALPESLLESELFGHKKGSFTHATADKKGMLQYADGGTIFLDEIADMSVGLQSKLLRFLQEGDIRPIGSNENIKVDVRVISASNKDLARLVKEGTFRQDLYFRLNGVMVTLPPLRERREDIPLLSEHFLQKIAEREKKPVNQLHPTVLQIFMRYDWPGNIRELQNTLETACLFAEGSVIVPKSLQFKPALYGDSQSSVPIPTLQTQNEALDPILEKTLLAIRDNCYHKGMAAKALGISRRALYARLQKFGLSTDLPTIKARIDASLGSS